MRQPNEITLANGRTLADVIADHRRWLLGDSGSRADLSGAYLSGADLSGADLSGADLSGADLSGADLSGAYLSGAYLSGAYLSGADLSRADLSGAYLSGADLSRADLSRANLSYANLSYANLSYADLSRANLSYADLSGAYLSRANLSEIEADVRALVREYPTAEVLGLLRALYLGRVDGSTYHGACACLVGSIANTRGCAPTLLACDGDRLAERWALAIRPGDAAPQHPIAGLTARWIEQELATRDDYQPGGFGSWIVPTYRTPDEMEAAGLALLHRAREARSAQPAPEETP